MKNAFIDIDLEEGIYLISSQADVDFIISRINGGISGESMLRELKDYTITPSLVYCLRVGTPEGVKKFYSTWSLTLKSFYEGFGYEILELPRNNYSVELL